MIGGTPIVSAASITFDLVFQTDNAAIEEAEAKNRLERDSRTITVEACETRLGVISKTDAIYFKTASAELEQESAPILNSVAEVAEHCPAVQITVSGYTDNVGGPAYNQRLSEQRAKSVVDYLQAKGVAAARIQSAGYGDTRPVASNETETGRAKNRRIEFTVTKG